MWFKLGFSKPSSQGHSMNTASPQYFRKSMGEVKKRSNKPSTPWVRTLEVVDAGKLERTWWLQMSPWRHAPLSSLKLSRRMLSSLACYQCSSYKNVTLSGMAIYSISQEGHSRHPNEQGCLWTLHRLALAMREGAGRGKTIFKHLNSPWPLYTVQVCT